MRQVYVKSFVKYPALAGGLDGRAVVIFLPSHRAYRPRPIVIHQGLRP